MRVEWGGVARISLLFYSEGLRYVEESGEGRVGTWEFRNHCICMQPDTYSMLWLEEK